MIAGQAQLGSAFHPAVSGIAGKVQFLGINETMALGMPWMIAGDMMWVKMIMLLML